MRRPAVAWLIGALLLLAAVGAFLDREQMGSGVRGGGPGLEDLAASSGGRFRDPIAVRRQWPGADIVMDTACRPIDVHRYRALAEPRSIVVGRLPVLPPLDRSPTREGAWRNHQWVIHTDAELTTRAHDALLVWCERNTFTAVQSGLIAGVDPALLSVAEADRWVTWITSPPRRPATDIAADFFVLVGLMLFGGVLLPAGQHAARPALALLVGLSSWGLLGLLLVSTASMALLALAAALLVVRATRPVTAGHIAFGWTRADIGSTSAYLGLLLLVIIRVRTGGWHLLHTDSMAFLLGGWAFAAGSMDATLLDPKRGLVLQSLHGPGFLLRVEGLQSLAAVSHVTGVWLLAVTLAGRHRRTPGAWAGIAAATTLLLVSPFLVRSSALINSHLLVGGLLLAVVILWEGGAERRSDGELRRAVVAVSALSGAIVLLRPEGILVVALVLLGTLWSGTRWRVWMPVWRIVGATSVVWGALLAFGEIQRGLPVGLDRSSAILLGLLVMLAPEVLRRLSGVMVRRLPPVLLIVLWTVALIVVAVRGGRVRFFAAARENVLMGRGGWGLLWVTLLMLVLVGLGRALGSDRVRTLGPALMLLIGFAPLTMFVKMLDNVRTFDLERMLSGGGRVGYFDSVNRMWMHVLFVALYLGVSQGLKGPGEPVTSRVRRARTAIVVRASTVTLLALLVARLWDPIYAEAASLRVESVSQLASVVTVDGTRVVAELVDGSSVEQVVLLDDRIRPTPEARIKKICVAVSFVTFARANTGEVRIALTHGGRSSVTTLSSDELPDWGTASACLDVPADLDLAVPLVIVVSGHGGELGGSPAVLHGSGSVIGDGVLIASATRSESTRASVVTLPGPMGLELTVESVEPASLAVGSFVRSRTLLAMPLLMALLIGAIMALDARSLLRPVRSDGSSGRTER